MLCISPVMGYFCLLLDWHVVVLVGLVKILFCLCPVVGSQACFVAVVLQGGTALGLLGFGCMQDNCCWVYALLWGPIVCCFFADC